MRSAATVVHRAFAGFALAILVACRHESETQRAARVHDEIVDACHNYDHAKATGEWGQLLPGDMTYCDFVRKQAAGAR